MQWFRFPFLGNAYGRSTQYEDRRARFGRHRFAEATQKTVRCGYCPALLLSLMYKALMYNAQKEINIRQDSDLVHSSTAAATAERPEVIPPHTSRRLTSITNTTNVFVSAVAAAFFILAFIVVMTGDLCIEVVLQANSLIGARFSTEKFGRPQGPCFAHVAEFGQLRIEASFGSWSPSVGAVDYANVAKGGKSIPALTSPLYSPPIRLDLTRVDKTFWKSFGPRPIIHPPEMALSGGTSPGQCWAFAGHTGQLGIRLPEPVRVTSFTVEHTGNGSLTDSAPRNIILWGLVPKDTKDVSLGSHTHIYRATSHTEPQFGTLHIGIPLASVTFDAVEGQARQTFPVGCSERRRTFDSLVAQFVGNWGHPDFTCLYRFEITGHTL